MTRKNEFANSVADDFPDIMSALNAEGLAALQEAAGGAAAPGGESLLQVATVTLTDAQIKALPTTPVEIVAAQPGKAIVPVTATFNLDWTGNYTNINANAGIRLRTTGGTLVLYRLNESPDFLVTALLACGGDSFMVVGQRWPPDMGIPPTDFNNVVLDVSNASDGDLTDGNASNTLTVTVYFVVVDL